MNLPQHDANMAGGSPQVLITLDNVMALIDEAAERLAPVQRDLPNALGCVLAADVHADQDHPGWDCSAIDGYSVAMQQSARDFTLDGELHPGNPPPEVLPSGVAIRIFTGSAVPAQSELVMLEDAEEAHGRVRFNRAPTADFIRHRGSSYRSGTRLLQAGALLTPGRITLLAAAGQTQPEVISRPRLAHVTTGSELIAAGQKCSPWQIRNTNAPLIRALSDAGGAVFVGHAHVSEAADQLVQCVKALPAFEVLLVSGGSSVGRYDNTTEALQKLGFEILVRRVNLRPGKPLVIARRGAQWAFGLPGNPISHFATFNLFVHRLLCRLAGRQPPAFLRVRFAGSAPIAANARESLHPASLIAGGDAGQLVADNLPWSDSGDLSVLDRANGFLRVPVGLALLPGDQASFLPAVGAAESILPSFYPYFRP